jgi:hypothetical protein
MKRALVLSVAVVLSMCFALAANAQSTADDHNRTFLGRQAEIMKEKAALEKAEGQLMIQKGKLMIKEGEMMIAHGKEGLKLVPGADDQNHNWLIAEGEMMVKKGQAVMKEGESMIMRSYMGMQEAEFMLNYTKKK